MRRGLSLIAIASLAISLTGCGAGFNASTRQINQVTDGVEASIKTEENNIRVVNLLVVSVPGGNAVLVGTIVNAADQEDALLGVAIGGNVATVIGKSLLPKNSPIIFEGERSNAKAVLTDFGGVAGTRVPVTLFLARAGEITVDAIIREASDEYAGITASVPTVTPSPTPSN